MAKLRLPPAELLNAYLRLAMKVPLSHITLQKLAHEAKSSYTKIHYYFGGKQNELAVAAANYVVNTASDYVGRALEQVRAQALPKSLLESYVDIHFDWADQFPSHASFWLYFLYRGSTNDKLAVDLRRRFTSAGKVRIVGLLREDIGRGLFPRGADSDDNVASIQGILIGNLIQWNLSDSSRTEWARLTSYGVHRLLIGK